MRAEQQGTIDRMASQAVREPSAVSGRCVRSGALRSPLLRAASLALAFVAWAGVYHRDLAPSAPPAPTVADGAARDGGELQRATPTADSHQYRHHERELPASGDLAALEPEQTEDDGRFDVLLACPFQTLEPLPRSDRQILRVASVALRVRWVLSSAMPRGPPSPSAIV